MWFSLEALLGLPLEPAGLAVVWREALQQLRHQPALGDPGHSEGQGACRAALERALGEALDQQELQRIRRLCQGGEWQAGLNRLEALVDACDFSSQLAPLLLELLPVLHHQLVDLAEQDPSACPFDGQQQAELLWSAHRWLERLERHGIPEPERMAVIREQISRYGAIAWMEQDTPRALECSVVLLLALLRQEPTARDWALPACRIRLAQLLQACAAQLDGHVLSWQLQRQLQKLLDHGDQLTALDPDPALQQQLLDLRQGLQVWEQFPVAT